MPRAEHPGHAPAATLREGVSFLAALAPLFTSGLAYSPLTQRVREEVAELNFEFSFWSRQGSGSRWWRTAERRSGSAASAPRGRRARRGGSYFESFGSEPLPAQGAGYPTAEAPDARASGGDSPTPSLSERGRASRSGVGAEGADPLWAGPDGHPTRGTEREAPVRTG